MHPGDLVLWFPQISTCSPNCLTSFVRYVYTAITLNELSENIVSCHELMHKTVCWLVKQIVWQILVPEGRIVENDWSDETQKWYCPTEGTEKPCSHPTTCVNFREVYLRYWKPILPYIKATLVMRFLQPLPLVDNGAYIPDGPYSARQW